MSEPVASEATATGTPVLPEATRERQGATPSGSSAAPWEAVERRHQLRRLRTFLRWFLVPFFVFGPYDLWIWWDQGDAASGAIGLIVLGLIPVLLWGRAEAVRGRLERATAITITSLLLPAFVIVFIRPYLFPVLAVGTLLAVAVALSFANRATLRRLLVVGFADAVAICGVGATLVGPSGAYYPSGGRVGLAAVSLAVVIGLVFFMLALFDSRLRENLERTKRAHESLARAHDELQTMDRRRTAFMSATAHEIFTPLTPMGIQLHLLQRQQERLAPEQQTAIRMIQRNFERLRHLAGDLLDTSRVESGKLRVNRKPLRLGQLAAESVAMHQRMADQQGVQVSGELDDTIEFWGDAQRLSQVFDNLIGNALKFTPRGGWIKVSLQAGPDTVRYTVHDNGIGIEPADQERLFHPFNQLGGPERGGTGLGLFISKGIVEAHGGSVRCESEGAGRGSRFIVELPRTPGSGPAGAPVLGIAEPAS